MAKQDKKLLIIDDEETSRAILKEAFKNDYSFLEASNGKDGLNLILEYGTAISAVFLDIFMPGFSGFDVLEELTKKDLLRQIPVFLVTTDHSSDVVSRSYNYEVVDIIHKPYNLLVIKRRVKNIVELYNNRKEMELLLNVQTNLISNQDRELRENQWAIIETLGSALESRDTESGDHVSRIKDITCILAKGIAVTHPEYMLTNEKVELITHAATLHDAGKIAIPDSILRKPASAGRLTPEEFTIMKTHTLEGCKLINNIPHFKESELYPFCYSICRNHHERWDGSGYPDGLKGDDIPIAAQIVSIADVYDALINKRVYKDAYPREKTVEMILNGECGKFNPQLMECFKSVEPEIYRQVQPLLGRK